MAITSASESEKVPIDWISTGITGLDSLLGGGIPTKRITEIFGPYSVGKTSLAYLILAQAQKEGRVAMLADIEWSFEPEYARTLELDLDKLLLLQSKHAEDALDELEGFAEKHKDAVIVLDAVGALLPRTEAEKTNGEKTIGGQASLVARFCRKITPLLHENNIALVVLNHQFTDLMTGALKTSGGAKLEYSKAISISLKRAYGKTAKRSTDGKIFEVVIEAEVRKNKLKGTLGGKVNLFMEPGKGFLKIADQFQEMLDKGEIVKNQNTYYYKEEKMGVGIKQAREWLKLNYEQKSD